jgi:hypothetical protein
VLAIVCEVFRGIPDCGGETNMYDAGAHRRNVNLGYKNDYIETREEQQDAFPLEEPWLKRLIALLRMYWRTCWFVPIMYILNCQARQPGKCLRKKEMYR